MQHLPRLCVYVTIFFWVPVGDESFSGHIMGILSMVLINTFTSLPGRGTILTCQSTVF